MMIFLLIASFFHILAWSCFGLVSFKASGKIQILKDCVLTHDTIAINFKCSRLGGFRLPSNLSDDEIQKMARMNSTMLRFIFNLKHAEIIDTSIDLGQMTQRPKFSYIEINMKNVLGFAIDAFDDQTPQEQFLLDQLDLAQNFQISFIQARFDLYDASKEHNRIRTCQDYLTRHRPGRVSFFQTRPMPTVVFKTSRYHTPVCPLVFNNSIIGTLVFSHLINSYYKRRVPAFHPIPDATVMECVFDGIAFDSVENIDLDLNLTQPEILRRTFTYEVYGQVNSIHVDLFRPENAPSIRCITLSFIFFKRLIHR